MNKVITTATISRSNSYSPIDNWIAFDLEWEIEPELLQININYPCSRSPYNTDFASDSSVILQDYHKILTFGYEDSYGNIGTFCLTEFNNHPNPQQTFLTSIKEKLQRYSYCFAWGSKAVKHRNQQKGNVEGINGDLVMLDINFIQNNVPSIVKYDKFSGMPFIKNFSTNIIDIDILKVFAKPLVKYVIYKNKYKSLRIHEVATALLGHGKLDNKSGYNIAKMSISERKEYCQNDAHLVAELVKIDNGNILKIMQVIASHTGLKLEEVCHKGMTGIWTKILNDVISRRVELVGFDNLPFTLRKLYSSNHRPYSEYSSIENEFEEYEAEEEESGDEFSYNPQNNQEDGEGYSTKANHRIEIETKESVKKYKGAIVLEPVRGLHHNVYLFDVTSLYPTMIIKYNLSPETVN